ncbi:hypothetical protein ACF09J_07850 [Streptomyces sp. NPDC014889]
MPESEPLALTALAGIACWLLGSLFFLASGVTHLVHTIRDRRHQEQP